MKRSPIRRRHHSWRYHMTAEVCEDRTLPSGSALSFLTGAALPPGQADHPDVAAPGLLRRLEAEDVSARVHEVRGNGIGWYVSGLPPAVNGHDRDEDGARLPDLIHELGRGHGNLTRNEHDEDGGHGRGDPPPVISPPGHHACSVLSFSVFLSG